MSACHERRVVIREWPASVAANPTATMSAAAILRFGIPKDMPRCGPDRQARPSRLQLEGLLAARARCRLRRLGRGGGGERDGVEHHLFPRLVAPTHFGLWIRIERIV